MHTNRQTVGTERRRLTVLITNNTLNTRGGSECYAMDVARFLIKRGHTVLAYSTSLGAISNEMSSTGVTVVDSLADIKAKPDIIHGQHHMDTLAALLYFPNVPVVHFVHGLLPWEEHPLPDLSCIFFVVLVSEFLKMKLLEKDLINESKVRIVPNFVDEHRFTRRRTASANSKKLQILVYGNYKPKEFDEICSAAKILDAQLDTIGQWSPSGNKPNPEDFLPCYDLVFAYGRSALEAIYCGCEVVACHNTGTGVLIDNSNFDEHRKSNFGFSCCQGEQGLSGMISILERVAKCKSEDKEILSLTQRESLAAEKYLVKLEDLYYETLRKGQATEHQAAIKRNHRDMQLIASHIVLMKMNHSLLSSELAHAKADATRAKVEATKANMDATEARAEAHAFSRELRSIKESKAWRATYPLRATLDGIKKLMRP